MFVKIEQNNTTAHSPTDFNWDIFATTVKTLNVWYVSKAGRRGDHRALSEGRGREGDMPGQGSVQHGLKHSMDSSETIRSELKCGHDRF